MSDERIRELAAPGAGWAALMVRTLLVLFTIVVVVFDYGVAFGLLPRIEESLRSLYPVVPWFTELAFSLAFRWSIVLFSLAGLGLILFFWKLLDTRWGTVLVSLVVLILACVYGTFMLIAALLPMILSPATPRG
jgi:type II secretory pathway component PulF